MSTVGFTITNNSRETSPGVQPVLKVVGTVQYDPTPVLVVLEHGQSYTAGGEAQGTWDVSSLETGNPVLICNIINSPVGNFRLDYAPDFVAGKYDIPITFNASPEVRRFYDDVLYHVVNLYSINLES